MILLREGPRCDGKEVKDLPANTAARVCVVWPRGNHCELSRGMPRHSAAEDAREAPVTKGTN